MRGKLKNLKSKLVCYVAHFMTSREWRRRKKNYNKRIGEWGGNYSLAISVMDKWRAQTMHARTDKMSCMWRTKLVWHLRVI